MNQPTETGLLSQWPAEGPELLWTIAGLSSNTLYGVDIKTGKLLWQTERMDNHHGGVILHDGCGSNALLPG
jgi:hypothetical protein